MRKTNETTEAQKLDLCAGYRHDELEAAWLRVKPRGHWKNPIDCIVWEHKEAEIRKILFAVEFFTATKASYTLEGVGKIRVTAAGYYAGPAN